MNYKIQKALPVILSMVSSVGVALTTYLCAKQTLKYSDELKELKKTNDKKLIVKECIKCYSPAIISGIATVTSITAGTIIGKKTEASLSATCLLLDGTLRRYKGKVKNVLGDKAQLIEKSIGTDIFLEKNKQMKTIGDDYDLYYEEHIGFFKAKPQDLQTAIDNLNMRLLSGECCLTLQLFLDDAKAKLLSADRVDKVSYDYGWTAEYLADVYGERFTDVTPTKKLLSVKLEPYTDSAGNVKYCILTFDKDPIFGISEQKLLGGYNLSNMDEENEATGLLFDEFKYMKGGK